MTPAFDTGGWRKIQRLADSEDPSMGPARYHLYVIEVEALVPTMRYLFYVGYTGKSPEIRFADHQAAGAKAWKHFRKGNARAVRIRHDLMEGLPTFRTLRSAKKAEGSLARIISTHMGPAYSDQVKSRKKGAPQKSTRAIGTN